MERDIRTPSRLSKFTKKFFDNLPTDGNVYSRDNVYNIQHPNATVKSGSPEDPKNIKGKGTGVFLDTSDGGGYYDKNGIPSIPNTGQKGIEALNKYTQNKPYDAFDI